MFKKIIPLILFVVSTNVFAVDDIPVAASFQRLYSTPLDSTIVFTNYNEAVTYAAGGATTNTTAYKGQYIAVPDSGVYYINDNWELEKIETSSDIDGKYVSLIEDKNNTYTAVTIGSRLLPSLIDIGPYSFVQGTNAIASGKFSHAEGYGELIGGTLSCAANSTSVTVIPFGQQGLDVGSYIIYNNEIFTVTSLNGNHNYTIDRVISSEPLNNVNVVLTAENGLYHSIRAEGDYSHAEGRGTKAIGDGSHAEGFLTKAIGDRSHAEGSITESLGNISHAEGYKTTASGRSSHAEGDSTYSIGDYSHSEGKSTQAIGDYSHAEGNHTIASNKYSHTDGFYSLVTNDCSYVWSGNNKKEIIITVTNDESIILSNYGTIDQSFTVGDIFTTGNWYDIDQIVINENRFLAWSWIPGYNNHIALIETHGSAEPTITDISDSLISTYSYLITDNLTYKLLTDYADSVTVKIPLVNVYYPSHGEGTFNINPTDGLNGFYIGDSNLQSKFDEYVKTNHIGDVSIAGNLTNIKHLETESIKNANYVAGGGDIGRYSLVSGYNCVAPETNSVALGQSSAATNNTSFVWNYGGPWYYDHGTGSFNINPNGGITNFWIGKTNLNDYISEATGNYVPLVKDSSGNNTAITIGNRFLSGYSGGPYTSTNIGKNSIVFGYFTRAPGKGAFINGSGGTYSGTITINANSTSAFISASGPSPSAGSFIIYNDKIFEITSVNSPGPSDPTTYGIDGIISDEDLNNEPIELAHSGNFTPSIQAIGDYSHAEGYGTKAVGNYSHTEGSSTLAEGLFSHAEGAGSTSRGYGSHAEGVGTTGQDAKYSHAEGRAIAYGQYAHAEGNYSIASNDYSHTDGYYSIATNDYAYVWNGDLNRPRQGTNHYTSHGDGTFNINPADGLNGFYIGETNLSGYLSSAGGTKVQTLNSLSGNVSLLNGNDHVTVTNDGNNIYVSVDDYLPLFPDSAGSKTAILIGNWSGSHIADYIGGLNSVAIGHRVDAIGSNSVAIGMNETMAIGNNSIAVGDMSKTYGDNSYAIGQYAISETNYTIAAGVLPRATNEYSFVWNGIYEFINGRPTYYIDNGPGTFNINPTNELDGFYIGEKNLTDHIYQQAQNLIFDMIDNGFEKDGLRYKLSIEPVITSESTFLLSDNTKETYDIMGSINRQWMIDNNFYTNNAWTKSIKSSMIGNNVDNIDMSAFNECTPLTSVVIPDTVTNIGFSAFWKCSNLEKVSIPSSVKNIGGSAFSYCSSLEKLTIGNGVTNIGDYAFAYCSNLPTATIPDSVLALGNNTFENCTNLNNVSIGNNIPNIRQMTFYGCNNLTNAVIGSSVSNIGMDAFNGCVKLLNITLPDSITSITDRAFYGCGLNSITIPNSVTSIGGMVFYNCTNLQSVIIGTGITSIGYRAFYGCSNLSSVTIGKSKADVQSMNYTNWGLKSGCVIHCDGGEDIQL